MFGRGSALGCRTLPAVKIVRRLVPAALFALAAVPLAHAEPASWMHPDGSVTVDGVTYASMTEWQRSDAFRASGARCGTPPPSERAMELAKASPTHCSFGQTSIQDEYNPGDTIEIPVAFHVIQSTSGTGNISDAMVQSQVDILNEDYEALTGTPGGSGTPGAIHFVLASVDADGNATTGIDRVTNNTYFTDPEGAKAALNWDPDLYFNVYSLDLGDSLLGYSSFPMDEAGASSDGVVLGWQFVGRNAPQGGVYDQGRTLTHEAGHYLGLFHTFQGGCQNSYTSGDLIVDTAADSQDHYGCPNTTSCGGQAVPVENYMEYTDDTCMTEFTPEQVNRMRCALVNYRPAMGNRWPTADFTYTTTDGFAFTFTDASADEDGEVVLREWDFGDGGDQLGGTDAEHTFDAGTYEVSLTVMDSSGARRRIVKTIVADPPPVADFRAEPAGGLNVQFVDESSDPNGEVVGWAWDFGDGTTSTEQDPEHLFEAVGTYTITLTVTDEAGATATVADDIMVTEDEGGGCCDAGGGAPAAPIGLSLGLAMLLFRRRRRR